MVMTVIHVSFNSDREIKLLQLMKHAQSITQNVKLH